MVSDQSARHFVHADAESHSGSIQFLGFLVRESNHHRHDEIVPHRKRMVRAKLARCESRSTRPRTTRPNDHSQTKEYSVIESTVEQRIDCSVSVCAATVPLIRELLDRCNTNRAMHRTRLAPKRQPPCRTCQHFVKRVDNITVSSKR